MLPFYKGSTISLHRGTQRKLINSRNDKKSFGVNIEIRDDWMETEWEVIITNPADCNTEEASRTDINVRILSDEYLHICVYFPLNRSRIINLQ